MRRFISFFMLAMLPLLAEENPVPAESKQESKESKEQELAKLSEALGHLIGKNFQSLGLSLDIEAFALGLKGDTKPPLSEEECLSALAAVQEENLLLAAEQSLKEANEFLTKNAETDEIVCLEDGKVQYKILQEGEGETVQEYNSPVLRYEGRYLNGQIFGTSHDEEMVALDESLIGFAKGVIGMREGEKRTLYIHPDLGYGQHALLIFDVEVVKADASADAQAASSGEDATTLE
jgi:peptidylprolyl isomerase